MKDQLKEEVKDNSESHITQESSKNIFGFDVINIKKEKDETNFESNTATAFDGVEEQESEKKSSKIKSSISCEICHKSFGATGALKLHMNIHTREKLFKCSDCDKEFLRNHGFKRHWLRVHKKEKLKAEIEKLHQCEYCDKKFMERNILINHTRVHTGEKPFECSKCGKKYARKDAMKGHMQTHMKKIIKPISCEICHTSFGTTGALKLHMNIHTREKLFKCSDCDKEFLRKHGFKRHWLRVHKKEKLKAEIEKSHQCVYCDKKFMERSVLINHTRVHTGEKLFECSKCGKTYSRKDALEVHMQTHIKNSKKPFSCEICRKNFSGTGVLKLHMNIHTREKLFKCSECDRVFLQKHNFTRHLLTHKDQSLKPISCEICHTSFGATGALKLHMNIHTREKLFKCTECDKEFLRKHGFKRHWLRVHKKEKLKAAIEKPHQCEYCDKKFMERSILINHIRVHTGEKPFECSKCGKTYSRKDAMKVHMKTHMKQNKKPFSCEICLKSFSGTGVLKLHMNIHTREKLFKCSECDREFLQKHNFTRHLLTHKKQSLKPFSCEICRKGFGDKYTFKLHMNIHTREKLFKCSECDREFLHKSNFKRHLQLTHKDEILKDNPHSNSGEIASSNESIGDIKSKFKTIKAEKIDENEIVITEYTDPEEKVKPVTDRKASSHLSYNSCFGETICKEEVILPDEIEVEWKNITKTIQ